MPGSGQTPGILKLTQYLPEDPIDLVGDYNADMKKISDFAQEQIGKEGAPNGLATLDRLGKLVQMPTASDVGAVSVSCMVNGKPLSSDIILSPADVGAQPQTTARKTMVKADASGTLVAAVANEDYGAISNKLPITPGTGLKRTGTGEAEAAYFFRNGNLGLLTFNLTATKNIPAWQNILSLPSGINIATTVRGVCLVGPSGNLSPKPFYIYNGNPPAAQLEFALGSGQLIMGCIPVPIA